MKLRIKGNSIRLRLTKTDVSKLCTEGFVEEQTHFPGAVLSYRLESSPGEIHSAALTENKLTVRIPAGFVSGWRDNDVVGTEGIFKSGDNPDLKILVEKDFKCLDTTHENQDDNYENPNQSC